MAGPVGTPAEGAVEPKGLRSANGHPKGIPADGTIGFYDEVPVFFIVTVAIIIFFLSAMNAYNNIPEEREEIAHLEDVQEFLASVRHSPLLTHDGQPGMFESSKIMRLNIDNLTRSFNFPGGVYLRIEIIDLGNYSVSYEKNITNTDSPMNLRAINKHHSVLTSPISIWVNDEQVHPGQLKVEMWK